MSTPITDRAEPALYDLLDPEVLADPYPHYRRLRALAPLHRDPKLGAWIVTRHADVTAVLPDPRFGKDFSAFEGNRVSSVRGGPDAPLVAELSRWMLYKDPPDHTRLRALVTKAFTPRMVEGMRPRILQIVHSLIGRVAERGTMEVIADLAVRLPVNMICGLLGFPEQDYDQCRIWADALARGLDPLQTPETVAAADAAVGEATRYVRDVVAERRRRPGPDLVSSLLAAEEAEARLTEQEVVSTIVLLFFAGHQTTRDLIGNGLLALLQNPDQLFRLRGNPSLVRDGVEELLRYDSPVQMLPRWAREDVTLAGTRIAAGEQLIVLLGAANRDPDRFVRPDSLELGRADVRSLLSFGGGAHFCLGAALAKAEAQIAIPALVALPELELDATRLEWRQQIALRGLAALPVSFRPGLPWTG